MKNDTQIIIYKLRIFVQILLLCVNTLCIVEIIKHHIPHIRFLQKITSFSLLDLKLWSNK